jgi:ribonuclease BN (tRNA processing enzyme)
MQLTFIGSGDAFGSGGRFNTCFLVVGTACRFLIDCGASSLVALKRAGIDINTIDGVVLSHLHGDHFGGLPFFLLDSQHVARRSRPLFITGPTGLAARLTAAQEALFPGSSATALRFPLSIAEMAAGERREDGGFAVTTFPADHSAGAPCFHLRFEVDGKVVTYSGDTGWTAALPIAARGADLFICECSGYGRAVTGHLAYGDLAPRLAAVEAKRIVLTHMSPDMLARRHESVFETAEDGLTLTL